MPPVCGVTLSGQVTVDGVPAGTCSLIFDVRADLTLSISMLAPPVLTEALPQLAATAVAASPPASISAPRKKEREEDVVRMKRSRWSPRL